MIEITNLTKRYRNGCVANQGISLKIAPGEIFGLLGPNGAGKTTLVNQLIGLLKPSAGTITIDGVDVVADPGASRRLCSFQPQSQIPIEGLTPLEAIELTGRIRGMNKKAARLRAKSLIERLQLEQWAGVHGENLSGGIRRLTAFCMTCVAPAKAVVLDEPTNDVDPQRRRLLWKEIKSIAAEGSTIILVTHNVLEAERSTDRLAIIHQARLIRQGTPASFRDSEEEDMILELILEPGKNPGSILREEANAIRSGRRIFCPVKIGEVVERVRWANQLKKEQLIEEFSINPPSLEESYLQIIANGEDNNGIVANNIQEEK